jgi:predicted  nucleic acid-binding Zn-ribbon protein
MLPDLERLVALQDIETRAAAAAQIVAQAPIRIEELDARITAARAAVADGRQALADNQAARRSVDKDLLVVQQRLEKYKEQSMAVKTNTEFHAMQHQMAAAKAEIDQFESRILETMVAADEIAARIKAAEAALKADETSVAAERAAIETNAAAQQVVVAECAARRRALVALMDKGTVALFESLIKSRGGIAVARAEKERCVVCQVRLRPMVYNVVIKNEAIVQCDSCRRILYFVQPTPAS